MTRAAVEGTFVLNGLMEGPRPGDPQVEKDIRQWVRGMGEKSIAFHLELTGGGFSLLPDDTPQTSQQFGKPLHEALAQALQELLDLIPPELRGRVTSTLRSSEFRPGEEVQSIYVIDGRGKIRLEQRVVDAETVAPPQPLSPRDVVRTFFIGLVVAAAIIGITSLFVDVPGLVRQLIGTIQPVRADEVQIDNTAYDAFFGVEIQNVTSDVLSIKLGRTANYPTTDASLQQAADAAEGNIKRWLAVAALARGYVRCDIFDSDSHYVTSATIRISELRSQELLNVEIPLRARTRYRLGKIAFAL